MTKWLKEGEIEAGDVVRLDSGFECAVATRVVIEQDVQGLYFACSMGRHYIEGQLDEGSEYVGISRP